MIVRGLSILSVIFLVSCTPKVDTPTNTGSTTSKVTPHITQGPVTPTIQSGAQMIPTPTYGTGKVIVEIFSDFQCPACSQFSQQVEPIFEEYASAGKLQIIYRQFPLTTIHKNAMGDAMAALCAAEQGKYMPYKKALYSLEKNKAGATVSDKERISLASNLELDISKFTSCLSTQAYKKQVEMDITYGDSMGVQGTPTTFINGVRLNMGLFQQSGIPGFRKYLEGLMK